jgi:hypothetical protein
MEINKENYDGMARVNIYENKKAVGFTWIPFKKNGKRKAITEYYLNNAI